MSVAILIPVLARPWRVEDVLADIAAATPPPYRALFVADDNDRGELDALHAAGADHIAVPRFTSYAAKINAGFAATTEPLLFSAADDLHFHRGWLEAASARLGPRTHVVGTNDLGNPRVVSGEHSTHTLFTRSYIDTVGGTVDGGPGVVLHPAYPHAWCDDEFIGTARARGVYAHAPDAAVEHLHYLWGKGEMDATYRRGAANSGRGRRIFERRRVLWER